MGARGKLGEHEISERVARGVAECNSSLTSVAVLSSWNHETIQLEILSKDQVLETPKSLNLLKEKQSYRAKKKKELRTSAICRRHSIRSMVGRAPLEYRPRFSATESDRSLHPDHVLNYQ